ncbi:MAG: hypothetical protein A2270_00570 [Elusimicrobia bacterium RIFOXYA12_FULL_51_18]|nr:MAG: hypothetical protein A2270_00570 [Elusimicrobia bacterium RIFOXYA12_FULL_51_18]OGS28991.1 MAG: hypothetical protein A2218_08585 [Elusimicrobia bacterium RIFOXYA2_FULL_53_38]
MNKFIFTALVTVLLFNGSAAIRAEETMVSKYKTTFYGQVKTDVVYDEHGVTGDDYMQYVVSKHDNERDFRMSARGTRLGFDITDGANVSGKIETDFIGLSESVGGTAGSTTDLRLRHAYVNVKAGKLEILAGQTWHLLPLEFSGTNNEFALGYSGVLWFRAPQLRVTYKRSDRLTYALAVVRPTRKLTDSEGTASGFPQVQAQAQLKAGTAKFTLMGAVGQWRNTTTGQRGDITLADLGYNIPLNSLVTLNGQLWTGRNLYDFLGGIGNMGYGSDEVKASGGFANINVKPEGKFSYNAAYGIDDPVNKKIAAAATAKTKNMTMLANVVYLYDKVTVTMEAARQITEYKLSTGFKTLFNMHYQLSAKFPF